MKQFIFLIRTNPDSLTPDLVNEMGRRWQPLINSWTKKSILISSLIFREAGTVLSGGGKREQTYLREQNKVLTGCFVLKAKDFEGAIALGLEFPTLTIGGSVEIRELQKFSNNDTN